MSNTTQLPADVRERVLTMLTAMEWTALVEHHDGRWYACCPWCGGENPDDDETPPGRAGHAERCELAAVIALLRTPRGEGAGVVAAASAYLRALDTYRKECRDREIPLAEYAYDEFRRLAEPLVEAEERLRAALRSEAQGELVKEAVALIDEAVSEIAGY